MLPEVKHTVHSKDCWFLRSVSNLPDRGTGYFGEPAKHWYANRLLRFVADPTVRVLSTDLCLDCERNISGSSWIFDSEAFTIIPLCPPEFIQMPLENCFQMTNAPGWRCVERNKLVWTPGLSLIAVRHHILSWSGSFLSSCGRDLGFRHEHHAPPELRA